MPIIGAGITKLSQLIIDTVKNWAGQRVDNVGAPNTDDDVPRAQAGDILSGRFGMPRMPAGTSGQVLTAQGAGVDPAYGASSLDIFDRFREFLPWVSLDGFTIGGDAGYSIQALSPYLWMLPNAAADNDAKLSGSEMPKLVEAGKLVSIEFPLYRLQSTASQNIWLRIATETADPPSEIINHFGWKVIGADLYASNADGAAQTITDTTVDLAAAWQRTRLKMVLNPGTDCKFYVNGVLKVTHDTNLPTGASFCLHYHTRTLAAAAKLLLLGRPLIEKVEA